MKHKFVKVTEVEVVGDHALKLAFSDGTEKIIDFASVLHGELFSPLRDKSLFQQVRIDDEIGTIVWPNGADFDPSSLYQWDQIVDKLSDQLRRPERDAAHRT